MTLLANVALADAGVVNEDEEKICHNLDNYFEKDLVGWRKDKKSQDKENKTIEEGLDTFLTGTNPGLAGGDKDNNPKLPYGFFLVETIRKKRIRQGQVQYLVKWIDWPESTNTWEPIEHLSECPLLIKAFEER
ncbi:hypothetical protein LIER_01482 [Lithospermum erythrorhizon]|uniref:Chromo domain-containing protein n=1 Tax=Lithospermum erythrorhizon TaxID=34254 RepID=A0AAV3NM96_LITER